MTADDLREQARTAARQTTVQHEQVGFIVKGDRCMAFSPADTQALRRLADDLDRAQKQSAAVQRPVVGGTS